MSSQSQIIVYLCSKCGWKDFHAAETCPRCHNRITKSPTTGQGRVATFTVIRYPPKGFEGEAPYIVALVDLANSLRVIGRIAANPGEIELGTAVEAVNHVNGALEFRVLSEKRKIP
jgi:uncharacterized OB-fold protein